MNVKNVSQFFISNARSFFKKISNYIGKENRVLVLTLSFLVAFSWATYAFATPPGSPYTAGETNNPNCIPGDPNCYVAIAGTGTVTSIIANSTLTGGTITTTGTIGIDLSHANTWTGQQTFSTSAPVFSMTTAGSILFAGASGILSQDNSNFFWDSTNHRLGIGTTTPTAALHLTSGSFLQTQGITPTVKGTVTNGTFLAGGLGLDVSGQYAYVAASSSSSFGVVDISNPASPVLVGSVQDFAQLTGAFYVKVAGKYAYVTSNSGDRLTIIDITNPAAPVIVSSLHDVTNFNSPRGLYISGKYAYVTANLGKRLNVIDISNPAAPFLVSTLNDTTNLNGADGVFVTGKYAYVAANQNNALSVFDVSNPASITYVTSVSDVSLLSGIHEVYVSGKYAYVICQGSNRLTVIDVSNPTSISIVGTLQDNTNFSAAKGLFFAGRYAYLTASTAKAFSVIDISNPASPVRVATLTDATNLNVVRDVKVVGKYAYMTMLSGLTVVDLSGIDTQGANIGSLASQSITVSENADIGNNLYIRNGLNVGPGGIQSGGALSLQGLTTSSSVATLDVRNSSGVPLLYARDDGNVGIGTATPGYTLEVGNVGVSGVVAHFVNSTGYCDVNPTTTSLTCSSDERLKKNITSIGNSMDTINRLRPVTYMWNTQTDSLMHPGFIAQEVESVLPDIVATDKNGFKSIGYSSLIPYLTKNIQELNLKIVPLESLDPTKSGSLAQRFVQFLADAVIHIKDLTVTEFHLGSAEKPTGVTFYDTVTGAPYCMTVTNGSQLVTAGVCGTPTAPSGNSSPVTNENSGGTDSNNATGNEPSTDGTGVAPENGGTNSENTILDGNTAPGSTENTLSSPPETTTETQ